MYALPTGTQWPISALWLYYWSHTKTKVRFGLGDPKSIRIKVKIFENNSTSGLDHFDL